jgi:hypothetical protein
MLESLTVMIIYVERPNLAPPQRSQTLESEDPVNHSTDARGPTSRERRGNGDISDEIVGNIRGNSGENDGENDGEIEGEADNWGKDKEEASQKENEMDLDVQNMGDRAKRRDRSQKRGQTYFAPW